jgi:LPXTG-motif cell wall-anchored protein
VRREFAAVDPSTGTIRSVAAFDFDATDEDDVTALSVWGAPALAATGSTASSLASPVAGALLLLGLAVLALPRRKAVSTRTGAGP